MTNIHFLEMIHQFDDIIQTHVLLQLQKNIQTGNSISMEKVVAMNNYNNKSIFSI